MLRHRTDLCLATASVWLLSGPGFAWAHPGHGGGFQDGWQHPLTGVDHLLAMIAVGLLAVRVGGRGTWLIPAAFLAAMILGGWAAHLGLVVPGVEAGIVASVLVLGGMVVAAGVAPTGIAASIVAAFAFLHGHAHGTEMAAGGSLASYAAGFLLATAILHLAGILAGAGLVRLRQDRIARLAGCGIAVCGVLMMFGWM